jgi:hypothetical protein
MPGIMIAHGLICLLLMDVCNSEVMAYKTMTANVKAALRMLQTHLCSFQDEVPTLAAMVSVCTNSYVKSSCS